MYIIYYAKRKKKTKTTNCCCFSHWSNLFPFIFVIVIKTECLGARRRAQTANAGPSIFLLLSISVTIILLPCCMSH